MGLTKTADGRYLVGLGVTDSNAYRGALGKRDMVIQYTEDGVTAQSMEYLTFLKDYAEHHAELGELIKPSDVSIWIAKDDKLMAVEADDISYSDGTFTLSSITYDGNDWTFGEPTPGGGGGGIPTPTAEDVGKVLTVAEDAEHTATQVIIPEQSLVFANVGGPETPQYQATISSPDFSGLTDGQSVDVYVDGTGYTGTYYANDDGNGHGGIYGDFGQVSYFLGNWLFEIGLEGDWTGAHTISVSASVPGVTTGWQNIGGVYSLSNTVSAAVQTLIGDVITDILTNSKTVPVMKTSTLTHSGVSDDTAILRTAAAAFMSGRQVASPVAADTLARAVEAYLGEDVEIQFFIPHFVQNIPSIGDRRFTVSLSFYGTTDSVVVAVTLQAITDIS